MCGCRARSAICRARPLATCISRLRTSGAQSRCAMWKSNALKVRQMPRDGEAVVARGRVGVYESSGQYQLYVESLLPLGAGDLALEFERLKRKLEAEGLFDPARKRALPALPRILGVVTSPSGAALQDIFESAWQALPDADGAAGSHRGARR